MQADLLKGAIEPLAVMLDVGETLGIPPAWRSALTEAGELLGLAMLAQVLAVLGAATSAARSGDTPVPSRDHRLVAGSGLVAVALLVWLVVHPSQQFEALFRRWDHLVFCGLAGMALGGVSHAARTWLLTALSLGLLVRYAGMLALGVALGTGVVGWTFAQTRVGVRPWLAVAVQGGLLGSAYGYCLHLRSESPTLAASVQGLFIWFVLRHVSAMVEIARGARVRARDYLAYVSCYPGAMGVFGAPEVYGEFARRNLAVEGRVDHRLAARRIVTGGAQTWLATLIPISISATLASTSTSEAWFNSLLLFVRTALLAMGWWAFIDGAALFLGIRLRLNFFGLLTCENPSDLWRSWRGTMTNWLIHHVYAPLGASRHPARNVFAAFGVSLGWHWLGVPFAGRDAHLGTFAPITLWAAVNAVAVVAHQYGRRRGLVVLPPGIPAVLRRSTKVLLVYALGSLAITLPEFQRLGAQQFAAFLRLLLGLPS